MKRLFSVMALAVSSLAWADALTVPGVLRPVQQASLSFEQPGIIEEIAFGLGENVEQGDLLARLNCRLFEGELEQSVAETRAAATRVDVDRRLAELGSVGAETLALNEIELEKARVTQSIAQLAVDRCEIRAPFDGVVNQTLARPFDAIQPNEPVFEIVSLDGAIIELVLPFSEAVELGDLVRVLDRNGLTQVAEVVALSPTVDPASQTRVAQAFIDSLPIQWAPGMAVQVSLAP